MSQLVSQTQKISAVVLSISLCTSAVFAYQKQQKPQEQTRRVSTTPTPSLDAAQIAALNAEASKKANVLEAAQQAAFNAEIDAIARQYAPTTSQDEALKNAQRPIKTIPFNLSNQSEVHMVAVHQASCEENSWSSCDGETGTVNVTVDYRSKPIVLVLAAHNSVEWNVTIMPNTQVEQVIISGHASQRYRGLARHIPVAIYSHENSECSTNCWRGDANLPNLYHMTDDKPELNQKIMELTGKPVSSLQSTHQEKQFNIYSGIPKLTYETFPNS